MTTLPLRLPEALNAMATAHAIRAGVSLNQYIATLVAAHVGAQADAGRTFAARAARALGAWYQTFSANPARGGEICAASIRTLTTCKASIVLRRTFGNPPITA